MKHEDTWPLLDDLEAGRLPASTRALVEAHLAECAECSAQISVMRLLRQPDIARMVRDLPEMHPSSEQLSCYALTPQELPANDHEYVGRHVRSCAECRANGAMRR